MVTFPVLKKIKFLIQSTLKLHGVCYPWLCVCASASLRASPCVCEATMLLMRAHSAASYNAGRRPTSSYAHVLSKHRRPHWWGRILRRAWRRVADDVTHFRTPIINPLYGETNYTSQGSASPWQRHLPAKLPYGHTIGYGPTYVTGGGEGQFDFNHHMLFAICFARVFRYAFLALPLGLRTLRITLPSRDFTS